MPHDWRRFWLTLIAMVALGAFCLWRVQVTVWRPIAERYYLFPSDTWLGFIERCWFNDALYAFGMVGILYVLYTLREALTAHSHPSTEMLCTSESSLTEERWTERQVRGRRMIGTGTAIVLGWAWLEEIADLVPGYLFDKWDINAIYVGFALGCSMLHRLTHPAFGETPPFYASPPEQRRCLDDGTRILCVAYVWTYTFLTDPSTYGDRWFHIAELSTLIVGAMLLLRATTEQATSDSEAADVPLLIFRR